MQMSGKTALAAGGSNNNIVQGQPFEFIPVMATIEFGFYASGTTITLGNHEIDVILGGEQIASAMMPPASTTAKMPTYPDDFSLSVIAAQGDRLIIKARNLDGTNACTLYWTIILTPL